MSNKVPTFWLWFFSGIDGTAGWRRIADRWLLVHVLIGGVLFWLVPVSTSQASTVVMIPLVSVFVGLTFAWIANVQAVLMSDEVSELSEYREGGFSEYVFPFQLGVLIVLVCLIAWGLSGIGFPAVLLPEECAQLKKPVANLGLRWPLKANFDGCGLYAGSEIALFGLASLSIRECWRLISAAMLFIITRELIRKAKKDQTE